MTRTVEELQAKLGHLWSLGHGTALADTVVEESELEDERDRLIAELLADHARAAAAERVAEANLRHDLAFEAYQGAGANMEHESVEALDRRWAAVEATGTECERANAAYRALTETPDATG